MEQTWTPRPKPDRAERLERRIEFGDYGATRAFLEQLNDLSEQLGRYPDISFGRTYVNLTLRPEPEQQLIGPEDEAFAAAIEALCTAAPPADGGP